MHLGNATTSEEEPRREVTTIIKLDEPVPALAPGDFGIWDLPDFLRREGLLDGRAIDDLVGCAALLLTLWAVSCERGATDLYAVFTQPSRSLNSPSPQTWALGSTAV